MPKSLFGALHQLVECNGLSGFEVEVRDRILGMQAGYLNDVFTDSIGNLIGSLSWGDGTGISILLVAHMDEIGFLVKSINKDGTLGIVPVGKGSQEGKSFDTEMVLSHRVVISCSEHLVDGVIGFSKIFHYAGKSPSAIDNELFVDIGANSVLQVQQYGVRIGDPVVFQSSLTPLIDTKVAGKALESRLPCLVLLETAKRLARRSFPNNAKVTFVWTAQKNIGEKGIKAIAHRGNYDLALVIDSSPAKSISTNYYDSNIGDGPTIRLGDGYYGLRRGLIPDKALFNLIRDTAEATKLAYQVEVVQGIVSEGKDLQVANIKTCVIGIPVRYSYSPVQIAALEDALGAIELATESITKLILGREH